MGLKTDHSRKITAKFQTNLVAGLLNHRRQGSRNLSGKVPAQGTNKTESGEVHVPASPKTKYTNAKGAAEYLGISKATFFRRRALGYFQPSPITGRYHLDDLDREAKGNPTTPGISISAEAAIQKTFGKSETTPLLAHGGSPSKIVSFEQNAI